MKIEWQKSGGSYVTIGDDAASPRTTIQVTQWGGEAQMQVEPLFRAASPFAEPRGNVAGMFAFAATKRFVRRRGCVMDRMEAPA